MERAADRNTSGQGRMSESIPISRRCRIHADKMQDEGWYVTANVLAAAADEIDGLLEELKHYKSLEANQLD